MQPWERDDISVFMHMYELHCPVQSTKYCNLELSVSFPSSGRLMSHVTL